MTGLCIVWITYKFVKQYSGKLSREKLFANYRLFAKIVSVNVLFFLTKIGQ